MKRLSAREMAYCALFAVLIMVGAMIRIPLPYVPFTMQTMFVFLSGLILGPRLGLLSALLYMAAGLIGLPVFSGGGGFMYVLQPSFGYILAFGPAAYLIGTLSKKRPDGSVRYHALCCVAGFLLIYCIGVAYLVAIRTLYLGKSVSLWGILYSGAIVFVPTDVFKCFLAAWLYKKLPKSLLPSQ